MKLKTLTLTLAVLALVVGGVCWTHAAPTSQAAAQDAAPEDAKLEKVKKGQSKVACYYGTEKKHNWHWARTENGDVLLVNGEWKRTKFTHVEKFFTIANSVTDQDVKQACITAKAIKKEELPYLAAFARRDAAFYTKKRPLVIVTDTGDHQVNPQF